MNLIISLFIIGLVIFLAMFVFNIVIYVVVGGIALIVAGINAAINYIRGNN